MYNKCAKYALNWFSGSREHNFFCQCIFAISFLSSLEKRSGPSFEQTRIPFTSECVVPSLVEIDQVVLDFKKCQFIFAIFRYYYFFLENGGVLHLSKL